jgi:signal transduction histidine kinase
MAVETNADSPLADGVGNPDTVPVRVLQSSLSAAQVGVIAISSEGKVQWLNSKAKSFFDIRQDVQGLDRETLYEEHITPHISCQQQSNKLIKKPSDEDTIESIQIQVTDREAQWLRYESEPMQAGELSDGMIECFTDITTQKEKAETLQSTTETLEVVSRHLRHDVQNDVQALQLWADRLALDLDKHQETLDKIQRLGQEIEELTEAGRTAMETVAVENKCPEKSPTDLKALLEDEVDGARKRFDDAEISFEGESATVAANKLLPAIFRNLLNNAVQHNTDSATVNVEMKRNGQTVSVTVEDDGPGICDNRKEDIFGKGEQALDSNGSGIGLFLVDKLTSMHGGSVCVEDSELSGAKFIVRLPVA